MSAALVDALAGVGPASLSSTPSTAHLVRIIATVVLLFVVATVIAVVSERAGFPYTVGLIVAGLVVGLAHPIHGVSLSSGLIYYVFLPPLLFEAAFNLQVRHLLDNWFGITMLAVLGVAASFALTALGMRAAGESWSVALVFGALIAATDPVSVVALFRRLRINARLTTIVEAESLFNDGTAAVIFVIVVGAVTHAGARSGVFYVADFAWMLGGALVVGLAIGYAAAQIHRLVDQHLVEITLSTIVAYGAFLLGERLGMSGVVACVTAGVVVGHFGRHEAFSAGTRAAMETFWEYAAFAVNSVIFLLIGMRIDFGTLKPLWSVIVLGFVVVVAARAVVVYSYGLATHLAHRPLPWSWQTVLVWGGLRGTVALALVLAAPADLPGRARLEVLVFGVVLLSLVGQGLTMRLLLGSLKMLPRGRRGERHEARADR
jgi:monovalent cation:H+ antiporter, CPA1 family